MYEMSKKKLEELDKEFAEKKVANTSFKELSSSKKVEHIWDYYKLHIIGTIIGLALIISMAVTIIININTIVILDVTFFTKEFEGATAEMANAYWYDMLYDEDNHKKQEIIIDHIDIRDDLPPDAQVGNQAKFMAKTTTHDFDVFIMESEFIEENNATGLLMDLSTIIDVEALGIEDSLLYYSGDQLVGINVTHQALIDPFTASDAEIYLGCYYGTLNVENAKIVINDLFK